MKKLDEAPVCFIDPEFSDDGIDCVVYCDWHYICASLLGEYFSIERRDFIRHLLKLGFRGTEPEVVEAIIKQYGGTKNATRLAVRYQRRKLELERRASNNPVVG